MRQQTRALFPGVVCWLRKDRVEQMDSSHLPLLALNLTHPLPQYSLHQPMDGEPAGPRVPLQQRQTAQDLNGCVGSEWIGDNRLWRTSYLGVDKFLWKLLSHR